MELFRLQDANLAAESDKNGSTHMKKKEPFLLEGKDCRE